jgi:hypothetical protein
MKMAKQSGSRQSPQKGLRRIRLMRLADQMKSLAQAFRAQAEVMKKNKKNKKKKR